MRLFVLKMVFATALGVLPQLACGADAPADPDPEPGAAADTVAPTWPPAASARVTSSGPRHVALEWSPAGDDRGVAGYRIYALGVPLASAAGTSKVLTQLEPDRAYTLDVYAVDAAGNESATGLGVTLHTPSSYASRPTSVAALAPAKP